MKLVLDDSVAVKWYLVQPDAAKAARLRSDFHKGLHELLAPDVLTVHAADVLVAAERKGLLDPGEAAPAITDLAFRVGIDLRPVRPLLSRATEISLSTRLTVAASLYVALAEQEQCPFLTADQKIVRNTRNRFPFVVTFDDHEIENNWADGVSQPDNEASNDPQRFLQLRANAFQAYYEHLPLRRPQRPTGSDMVLYRGLD